MAGRRSPTTVTGRPAAGGGHWAEVAPERLEAWIATFAGRHGPLDCRATPTTVELRAADGSLASCQVPFPPLEPREDLPVAGLVAGLVAHTLRPRRIGVLLVRLGGFAAGIVENGDLVASKVGARPVHGRSAAGGQSQKRFARRRDGQEALALAAAADTAVRVLVAEAAALDAVVVGGVRSALDQVLADPRLAGVRALVSGPVLDTPDPRLAVLTGLVPRLTAVRIRVVDTPSGPSPEASGAPPATA